MAIDDIFTNMELPKVNQRLGKSEEMLNKLHLGFLKVIKEIEKAENYNFKSYEIDCLLLKIIKKNHEGYLRMEFKGKE